MGSCCETTPFTDMENSQMKSTSVLIGENYTPMFRRTLGQQLGIMAKADAECITSIFVKEVEEGVEKLHVGFTMDEVVTEVAIDSDPEAGVDGLVFFKNLELITRVLPLTGMSKEWIETYIIRTMVNYGFVEYELVKTLDNATISAFMDELSDEDIDNGVELDLVTFESIQLPKYNDHGIIMNEELLHSTPVSIGSEDVPCFVRSFPLVQCGHRIAINQHIGVEILSRPRINVADVSEESGYISARTGKITWLSNGYSVIKRMPTYNETLQIHEPGIAIGDDGVGYEISLAGCSPIMSLVK